MKLTINQRADEWVEKQWFDKVNRPNLKTAWLAGYRARQYDELKVKK